LDIVTGRPELQGRLAEVPVLAQRLQLCSQAPRRIRIASIRCVKSVPALEESRWPGHAGFCQTCRDQPSVGGPARVQRLDGPALVHELHDAAGLAAGYAERMGHAPLIEPEHQTAGERGGERTPNRRELKSMPGKRAWGGEPHADKDFPPEHERAE